MGSTQSFSGRSLRPVLVGVSAAFAFWLVGCSGKTSSSNGNPDSENGAGGKRALDGGAGGIVATGGAAGAAGTENAGGTDAGAPLIVYSRVVIWDIAYGQGRFVAVGEEDDDSLQHSRGVIYMSTDADVWERGEVSPGVVIRQVEFGNGVFLAAADGFGVHELRRSTDGKTFTPVTTAPFRTDGSSFYAFGNGVFALPNEPVVTTPDGVTFEQHPAPEASTLATIAFGLGTFTFVEGRSHQLYVSPNAIDWTLTDVGQGQYHVSVVHAFEKALGAILYTDPGRPLSRASSLDGKTWKITAAIEADGGQADVPLPEFVMEDACISVRPTTFDTPSAPDTPCRALENDPAISSIAPAIAGSRAYNDGTYVLGGFGIATSHDAKTWKTTLSAPQPL